MYLIKRKLTAAPEQLYINVKDSNVDVLATHITVCNITDGSAKVFISFIKKGGTFEDGAIAYGADVAANSTVVFGDRVLLSDDVIMAYADGADRLVLSIDIEGDSGRYEAPV